ncbi:MAG: [FeFe] hydrogenase H-cluster radical SAM maturase HydE [Exilispira sp.]
MSTTNILSNYYLKLYLELENELEDFKKSKFTKIFPKLDNENLFNWYFNQKTEDLIKYSNYLCEKLYGKIVYLRGLIEFSNICQRDCLYCGIRKSNKNVNRYILTNEQIKNIILDGLSRGFKTFVLQSGENDKIIPEKISNLLFEIKNIKKSHMDDFAITLSCGVYQKEVYKSWKKYGANRYLLRFETSDEKIFKNLCPGRTLDERLKALDDLKILGYEVGSGFMVGLPGENHRTRINNILLCHHFQFDMVGIGPFIPHSQTPLKDEKPLLIEESIRLTALLRIILPFSNIPATTAAGTLDPFGREKMLCSGANVLMPNITPKERKKDYLLYDGKICINEEGYQCIGCLESRLEKINKNISLDKGDSLSYHIRIFNYKK